jgi:cyclophilin family peptidyl-prolyl cis-trans isomerase/HEAT repeat protein
MRPSKKTLSDCFTIWAQSLIFLLAVGCSSSENPSPDQSEKVLEPGISLTQIKLLEATRANPELFAPAFGTDASRELRARATLALARSEHVRALPLLKRALADPDPQVRVHAAFGLGQMDLALDTNLATHQMLRRKIARLLRKRHALEKDNDVKISLIRALGRVSDAEGLRYLIRIAAKSGPHRADALTAIGVSGARRNVLLTQDPSLVAAVLLGMTEPDARLRRAAAYAAFRHKVALGQETMNGLATETDAQTLIHFLRLLQSQPAESIRAADHLSSPDWRVRLEAVHALSKSQSDASRLLSIALQDMVAEIKSGVPGTMVYGHVVIAACETLSKMPVGFTDATLAKVITDLQPIRPFVACSCRAARDARRFRTDAVNSCAPSVDSVERQLFAIRSIHLASVSSEERVDALQTFLKNKDFRIRIAAAQVLVQERSEIGAKTAAARLAVEDDHGVITMLLQAFEQGRMTHLEDNLLGDVIQKLFADESSETIEPLVQAAKLMKLFKTPLAREALARLNQHKNPRVRHAALGIPYGEREFGPWARVPKTIEPALAQLPLGARLKTKRGDVVIEFFRETAPQTVDNFVQLARGKVYQGTRFHRIVPDFVSQGGDPRGDGNGGPGYTIPCENSDLTYDRGIVGMALAGKDSGGSQFFVTHSEQPHLDGRYTVFARTISGQEVLEAVLPGEALLDVEFLNVIPAR